MAEPVDEFERILRETTSSLEFERILRETTSSLNGIRLEVPALENGRPAPPTAQTWAIESLRPERPATPTAGAAVAGPKPRVENEPRLVVPVAVIEEEPQLVRSVELPPSTIPSPAPAQSPADLLPPPGPSPRPAPPSVETNRPTWPAPPRPKLLAAAAILAAGLGYGVWWGLRAPEGTVVLPVASFDAMAARDDDWLVSRQGELILFGPSSKPRLLASDTKRLTSIFWAGGNLYGLEGKNALFLWETLSAAPRAFSLDHIPVAIYARPPNVWTLDANGNLRQFLLAASMTGIFLQPLDFVAIHHSGDFSVSEDGSLLLLDRASGDLLRLARDKTSYTVIARSTSYGAGARLLPSKSGLWIATANGKNTALIRVPPPSH